MNGFVPKPVRQEKLFSTLLKFIRPEFESELSEMILKKDTVLTIQKTVSSSKEKTESTLPEINIHEAARNLNLDMDVYKKILSRFFNNNIHAMDRLRTAVNQNQWKHLQSLAHGLKGSSGNIGADQVKEAIEKIERFCRNIESDPSDKDRINILLGDFEKHFTRLLSFIKLTINTEKIPSADETPSEEDISQALPALSDLIDALKTADPIAINASIDCLKQFKTGFSMQSIENKINEYDYDDAIAALTQLISQWT
jgi:HPt (histidine-containing phosphotransfer) domain-containing protein